MASRGWLGSDPHPLLTEPILYVADPPDHVKWPNIKQTFSCCGVVSTPGKNLVQNLDPGAVKREKYPVRFANLFIAEMALATLQGVAVVGIKPPWPLVLSPSPTLEAPLPSGNRRFLCVWRGDEPSSIKDGVSPQMVFEWFRRAGPLVAVHTNMNVGCLKPATVLEFWHAEAVDTACMWTNDLHNDLRKLPKFDLRSYDPRRLLCSGFQSSSTGISKSRPPLLQKEVINKLSQFGEISSSHITELGEPGGHGMVIFESPHSAIRALKALNGIKIGTFHLHLVFEELDDSTTFAYPMPDVHEPANPRARGPDTTKARAQQPEEAAPQESRASADREAPVNAASAKLQRLAQLQLRREEADQTNDTVKKKLGSLRGDEASIAEDLSRAQSAQAEAEHELAEAKGACAAFKKFYLDAIERETKAAREIVGAQQKVANVKWSGHRVATEVKIAELEEMTSRMERDMLDRELAQILTELDEETVRQAELAESIERMQALKVEEELGKAEKVRQEQSIAEERLKREREEVERAAREQREREERVREEAQARQRAYDKAVENELVRCRARDLDLWPSTTLSAKQRDSCALERFKQVSEEFDTIAFQESQPLTVVSIPWPVLVHPHDIKLEIVDWTAVERFFKAVQRMSKDKAVYKALIEKAHRRFHPDKWRARGILNSVLDEELRSQLEAAGNVVAQAITPLWLESRK